MFTVVRILFMYCFAHISRKIEENTAREDFGDSFQQQRSDRRDERDRDRARPSLRDGRPELKLERGM